MPAPRSMLLLKLGRLNTAEQDHRRRIHRARKGAISGFRGCAAFDCRQVGRLIWRVDARTETLPWAEAVKFWSAASIVRVRYERLCGPPPPNKRVVDLVGAGRNRTSYLCRVWAVLCQ